MVNNYDNAGKGHMVIMKSDISPERIKTVYTNLDFDPMRNIENTNILPMDRDGNSDTETISSNIPSVISEALRKEYKLDGEKS